MIIKCPTCEKTIGKIDVSAIPDDKKATTTCPICKKKIILKKPDGPAHQNVAKEKKDLKKENAPGISENKAKDESTKSTTKHIKKIFKNKIIDLTVAEKQIKNGGIVYAPCPGYPDAPVQLTPGLRDNQIIHAAHPSSEKNWFLRIRIKILSESTPEGKDRERTVLKFVLLFIGFFLISLGDKWALGGESGIPVGYVGYLVVGVAILGFLGVNIFKGGPFDPDLDE